MDGWMDGLRMSGVGKKGKLIGGREKVEIASWIGKFNK